MNRKLVQGKCVILGVYASGTRQVNPGCHSVYLRSLPYCPSGCSATSGPLLQSPHSLHLGQHSSQHIPRNGDQNSVVRACRENVCVFVFFTIVHVCLCALGEAH